MRTTRKTLQFFRACSGLLFFHKMKRIINHPLLLELLYLRIKPKTQSQQGKKWYPIWGSRASKTIPYQAMHTYLPYIRDYLLPPKTSRVMWQANMDPDLDDKCQVIHEFSIVKCCFCYLKFLNSNIWNDSHRFLVTCHRKFHVFGKSDPRWSRD